MPTSVIPERVMGIETEFGISVLGAADANPMLASSQVVNAYAGATIRARRARWDFEEETPLRDARGFDLGRAEADASQLTDEDFGLANLILTNGARLYVDHAHPEYSSPEVTNALAAVLYDKAGEAVAARAAELASRNTGQQIVLYKNNTDGKGASYGTHENYLMPRSVPFSDIVAHLTPFFVSRQVVCGSGRVGIGQDSDVPGFQLSQRADFFEVEVGLETTLKRPIINTRDEPHAQAERYRRLHVIIGDANLAEMSTFLKVGSTALVLEMIEAKALRDDLSVANPIKSLREVSHDPTLRHLVRLVDGRRVRAIEMQASYVEQVQKFCADRYGADLPAVHGQVLNAWADTVDRLARDPRECARDLDWVAKLELLESYRDRDGLSWNHPKLALIDLQYSDLRPAKSLYQRLVSMGRMIRLTDDASVSYAQTHAPEDTRAYFRGECIRRYPNEVVAASWDSVIFDVPGRDALQRVPMMEPLRGTKEHVGPLLDRCPRASDLLAVLARANA